MCSIAGRRQAGYSFVELSIALLVIGLIVGATTLAGGLARTANYNTFFSRFIVGWSEAFKSYKAVDGGVPGHTSPGQNVNEDVDGAGARTERCNALIRGDMTSRAVDLPPGRGLNLETYALYSGVDGTHHQAEVCFLHVEDWTANPGGAVVAVNVMVIKNISADLASRLDVAIDVNADAANGDFRRGDNTNYRAAASVAWPAAFDVNGDMETVTAFYKMP